jgi:predicted DCC family thiol-disulfide oxidoreductase YuxK
MSVSELDKIGCRLLVIFDGYCGFCNRSVRWLLRRDRHDRLRFAPSQSPHVAELLIRHGFAPEGLAAGLNTILAVRDPGGPAEQVLLRSDAVIQMLGELPRPWPLIGVALGWVPRAVRDLVYRLIAPWRYRIWGGLGSCPLPTPEERSRFL